MSNVKVNGNTYNDVTSVKLPLADGSGFATYAEGAVTDNVTSSLLDGSLSGDYTNEEVTTICLNCFRNANVGTLSFPNAVKMNDGANSVVAENILLPRVSTIGNETPSFRSAKISGTLDLSALPDTLVGMNQTFYGAIIGTLKVGKMPYHNGAFSTATITNLVWNLANASSVKSLLNASTAITNAYVADAIYDEIQGYITDGTITKVTNLYKISEWSDG